MFLKRSVMTEHTSKICIYMYIYIYIILSFIQCWIYLSMFRDIDNYGKSLGAFFVESHLKRNSYYQFWIYTQNWIIQKHQNILSLC